jgi:hypothetical protein
MTHEGAGHEQPHNALSCAICAWISEENKVLDRTSRWVQQMLDGDVGPNVCVNVAIVRKSAQQQTD